MIEAQSEVLDICRSWGWLDNWQKGSWELARKRATVQALHRRRTAMFLLKRTQFYNLHHFYMGKIER